MKKKIMGLLLAASMAVSLAACGNASDSGNASGSAAETDAADGEKDGEASDDSAVDGSVDADGNPSGGAPAALAKEDIHIGAVFNSTQQEEGFTYCFEQGFKALEAEGYEVDYAWDIAESEECETAIESLIAQGCNVIYGLSYGFGEYMADVAEKYPDVYFNHYSGSITGDNMATFFPKIYQSEYLCGIVAGLRTETDEIGFLGSYAIPEVIRMINAFTLGAKSVNPNAEVQVKWTGSWFDPATETAATTELVHSGCDTIIAYLDSMSALVTADELGAWCFGYGTSSIESLPDSFLTNLAFDWGPFLLENVQSIIDGTWTGSSCWIGMEDGNGLVGIGDIYNSADGTQEAVDEAAAGFLTGTLDIWQGEILDNEGNIVVEKDETLSDADLLSMMFFVEGVNGSID